MTKLICDFISENSLPVSLSLLVHNLLGASQAKSETSSCIQRAGRGQISEGNVHRRLVFSDCKTSRSSHPAGKSFFFLRFYLFIHERHTEREAETQAEGKLAPCREPDIGPDPGTPGSRPGLKAGTKPLSHPGIPNWVESWIDKSDKQSLLETSYPKHKLSSMISCGTNRIPSNTRATLYVKMKVLDIKIFEVINM